MGSDWLHRQYTCLNRRCPKSCSHHPWLSGEFPSISLLERLLIQRVCWHVIRHRVVLSNSHDSHGKRCLISVRICGQVQLENIWVLKICRYLPLVFFSIRSQKVMASSTSVIVGLSSVLPSTIKYDVDLSCFDNLYPLVLRAMARHLDMALAAKLPVRYRSRRGR